MPSRITILSLVLLLVYCEQVPTTLDEIPYTESPVENTFTVAVTAFEFDILSWEFFFSVAAASPDSTLNIQAELLVSDRTIATVLLNDLGADNDIQINDGSFDGNWILPDSMSSYIDSIWTLAVEANSNGEAKTTELSIQPERPIPPVISQVVHTDTLTLPTTGLVLDTLELHLIHSGRDGIKDVSMISLKPDGTFANNGQPISLYDDGGNEIFYTIEGVDLTSGDKQAGDGIYSLLLPLTNTTLDGNYTWTFNARTWLGVAAEPFKDTLVVLPATTATSFNFDGGLQ